MWGEVMVLTTSLIEANFTILPNALKKIGALKKQ